MSQKRNPVIPIIFLASMVVGLGISMVEWGKPFGVHGRGLPIPTQIIGLPDDGPEFLKHVSELGAFATLLNVGLAALTGFIIWALIILVARMKT